MRRITFLDGSGDTTIAWDADVDEPMRAAIQRLLDKGYTFFIVEKLHDGKVTVTRDVTALDQLTQRSVVVQDEALSQLFSGGRIAVVQNATAAAVDTVGVARTVDEVIENRTIATRPLRGG